MEYDFKKSVAIVFGNILEKYLPNSGGLSNVICKPPHRNMLSYFDLCQWPFEVVCETGSVLCRIAPWDWFGEVTALFSAITRLCWKLILCYNSSRHKQSHSAIML